jgi:hypothetical protein
MRINLMTGNIVVSEFISLDSVIELGLEDSGLGNWTGPSDPGPEGDKFKIDELDGAAGLLLRRKTCDVFASAWPNSKNEYPR